MQPHKINIIRISNPANPSRRYNSKLGVALLPAVADLTMSIVYVVLDVLSALVTTSEICCISARRAPATAIGWEDDTKLRAGESFPGTHTIVASGSEQTALMPIELISAGIEIEYFVNGNGANAGVTVNTITPSLIANVVDSESKIEFESPENFAFATRADSVESEVAIESVVTR